MVGGKSDWFTEDIARELGAEIALRMRGSLDRPESTPTLRLSQMGPKCPKALWHSIHTPELAEPLPAPAKIKYTYGHTIEAMAIALAKAAGHTVEGEQDELSVLGVKGHRDCVIDGYVVDVKSSTGHYFKKFKDRTLALDDPFGYLDQLDGYLVGSAEDDVVIHKDVAFDWCIDKHLGNMVLYEHHLRHDHIIQRVADYKRITALPAPPECTCEVIKDGESGNLILGVNPSYSAFKHVCFPLLRIFIYSGGPRYFTRVARRPQPHVIEVDRFGNRVY